ncbi:laccase domain-containing protein, partial [Roseateles sp. GG27B]
MPNSAVSMASAAADIHADWLRPGWEAPHVRAFMTTRAGGVSQGPYASMNVGAAVEDSAVAVAQNRLLVSQALGAPAVFLWQVHGTQVLSLQRGHALPGVSAVQADAAVCTTPGLGVAIQVADCLPL